MSPRQCLALAVALCVICFTGGASSATPPSKVMLIGTFHFANPGRDMVKHPVIDVMTEENQDYLAGLATRLASFQPTDVLAECSPSQQDEYDAKFRDYVAGRFQLPNGETFQIGFRVAKAAGVSRVTCFDEDTIGWNAQPLFEYMERREKPSKQAMDAMYRALSARSALEQSTLALPQLLLLANDQARDAFNKGTYLRTNAIDAGHSFVGADASASWWHRNFRMYANIQKAASPGHRVIAIAGQGHTAILEDLLAVDSERQSESVTTYLAQDVP